MYAINYQLAGEAGRKTPYPFPRMAVGDAFVVRCRVLDQDATSNRVSVSAAYYQRKLGWRFSTRRQAGVRGQPSGVRVERIA